MNYPEWAPKTLVELHKLKTDPNRVEKAYKAFDPEAIVEDVLQKSVTPISEDNAENLRRQLYRNLFASLPEKEELALLEKLITDQNMMVVWATLSKRFKHEEKDPRKFFDMCQRGIIGWRGDPKQTPAERREFYQELYDTVARLETLMNGASGFDHYSINQLIQDDSIKWLIDTLGISAYPSDNETAFSYVKFTLSDVTPSIHDVFSDIGQKAIALRDESVPIKKPNSQNAGVHYFIRTLSSYCRLAYNQPLNEVVAITTSVVFDLSNCDESYVRKIAKV